VQPPAQGVVTIRQHVQADAEKAVSANDNETGDTEKNIALLFDGTTGLWVEHEPNQGGPRLLLHGASVPRLEPALERPAT
jgi:hypothetical protein